jgi:hypothetical protein
MFTYRQAGAVGSVTLGVMVPQAPDGLAATDERQTRLDWMRAEFRAAQQRQYEKRAIALVNRTMAAKPQPSPETEPPTRATPSSR